MLLKSHNFKRNIYFSHFLFKIALKIYINIVILQIMASKIKLKFIINPISGTQNKENIPDLINKKINKEKFDYDISFTEYAGHAAEIAHWSVDHMYPIVVAVGGDGTVNEVARSLVHTDTALGIIPCGSGNGLARHLQIPINIHKGIAIINNCKIESLDYGIINNMPFFCTCGMGFDAFISMKFAEAGKRGPITYVENVLKEGLNYKPETYIIEDENGKHKYKAFLIACANASQYGNNAYIAPQASMSDGLMDVIIMEPFTMFDAPQISIDMFNKTLDKNSKIKTFKAKKIHINREKPGVIHYDGDPIITDKDVDVHIESCGIKMIVNPDAENGTQPNVLLNAFSDFFNNMNLIREDIGKQGRKIYVINKLLLRKLNRL